MSTQPGIKLIKLVERKRRAKARAEHNRNTASGPEQKGRVNPAATVAGWVDELRRQKHQGAGAASDFNNLFEDAS